MTGCDQAREDEFFALFASYFDLERNTARRYSNEEYSLERMRPLAALAGNPERKIRVLHVAGTKGKGSTCHYLSALLAASGERAGVFASPHLVSVRERFQIAGEPVAYDVLLRTAGELEARIRDRGLTPSLFEIMTVLSLRLFVDMGCSFAVMETGIGGRLDSTNYIPDPELCLITPVSLDHTKLLGETVAEIAGEKAGILKPSVPLVISPQPFGDAEKVIIDRATELACPVHSKALPTEMSCRISASAPDFLQENFATAYRAIQVLGLVPDPQLFREPRLRGRFEIISETPLVMLDAAHNADSIRRLFAAVGKQFPTLKWTVVLGVVAGKDVEGMMAELADVSARFVLTNPRGHKGSELERLTKLAGRYGFDYTVIPEIREPSDLPVDSPLLFTGSFFTALIGEELFGG